MRVLRRRNGDWRKDVRSRTQTRLRRRDGESTSSVLQFLRFTYSNVVSSRLVHSRQFVEFMSENRLKEARSKKTYKAMVLVLLSLWICSSLYYWRSCGRINQEESTPRELTSPTKPQFCKASPGFPKIDWRGIADWKEYVNWPF